ncbi:MAG: ribbon-helix-helix domain-containing protein [Candidatus Saliniplasma sp.]
MPTKTRTLNVRITDEQYEELENLVERGEYTSKAEFIREILRERFDSFSKYLHQKAEKDREKHISLEKYGEKRGLE